MSENSENVILIIKAANQSISDLKIESELDQTVLHIKNRISEAHPIKPPAGEQRLIYSGQLLQDNLLLKTVLRHPAENNSYTIHLVCSTPRHLTSNRRPLESSQNLPSPQIRTTNENIVNPTEGMSDSTTDGIRRRLGVSIDAQTMQQPASVPIDPSTVYPHFSQFHPTLQFAADPIQQMAAMQQMYAHYMASYMQYMQSGAHDGFHFPQESTYSSVSTPIVGIPQTNVDNGNQQNQLPQNNNEQGQHNNQLAQPPNGPMRMNAQGGAGEEEEDGAPRDWLDYIYFSSRMIVLLCVVYFYSTVTRLMLVVFSCLFIYMYQAGWVRAFLRWGVEDQAQQQQQQQQQLRNNDVIHGPAHQRREEENLARPTRTEENEEEDIVREESLETEGENRELEGGEAVQNVVEGQPSIGHPIMEDLPPQPSLLALSWTFLTSFFISLIPEQHQIV